MSIGLSPEKTVQFDSQCQQTMQADSYQLVDTSIIYISLLQIIYKAVHPKKIGSLYILKTRKIRNKSERNYAQVYKTSGV